MPARNTIILLICTLIYGKLLFTTEITEILYIYFITKQQLRSIIMTEITVKKIKTSFLNDTISWHKERRIDWLESILDRGNPEPDIYEPLYIEAYTELLDLFKNNL